MQSPFLKFLQNDPLDSISKALTTLPIHSTASATALANRVLADAALIKKNMLAIAPSDRTYANTVRAYDHMTGIIGMACDALQTVQFLSTDIENRSTPYEKILNESAPLYTDTALYKAFIEYRDNGMVHETLTEEQKRYFDETISVFKYIGCHKDEATFARILELRNAIEEAKNSFEDTINCDTSAVVFDEADLVGVAPGFIAAQKRDDQGRVVLLCNGPTAAAVMPYCSNPTVRKALRKAFTRRGYPQNIDHLQKLLRLRQELAELLDFKDYASYALSCCMIETPAAAHKFLDTIAMQSNILMQKNIDALLPTLPDDVILVDGMLQPWDLAYATNAYQKAYFDIDPRKIAEYFPMETVVKGIFSIYEKFFGISLEYHETVPGAWNEEVGCIVVSTKDRSHLLGYVFLDLFPRAQKYSHLCCTQVVPHIWQETESGERHEIPAITIIIGNFPRPEGDKPALLLHSDAEGFFHEFGHAMHAILSCTQHTQTGGIPRMLTEATGLPIDFVELPSQMLEKWLWDPEILTLISCHYQTKEPLPDALIQKMITARNAKIGLQEASQTFLSALSLSYHEAPAPVDLDGMLETLYRDLQPGIAFDKDDNKFYASFAHLGMYGPAYYGYSLSRAYSYDVFSRIKEHGLLNEEIGAQFVDCILRPGGSKEPHELLADFLERPASVDAYLTWLKEIAS